MAPFYKKIFFPIFRYLGGKKITENFSEEPIIIGGCGRSGTTLLLSILDAHPNIYSMKKENGAFLVWENNQPKRIDRLYRYFAFNSVPQDPSRYCLKNPGNVRYFGNILDYYNNQVKLIHIVRDARDVLTSVHPKNKNDYWVSIERWINDVSAGLEFKDHDRVYTVKYEDLIRNYSDTVKDLLNFLNEDYLEQMQNWTENTELVESKAWDSQVQKLHSDSIARWQKPEYKDRTEKIMNNETVTSMLKKLNYID